MATQTSYNISRPDFVVDIASVTRNSGRQIDWANVAAGYVNALTGKKELPAGTVIGEALSTNGKISPRAATTNPATGILETRAIEGADAHALTGYGVLVGGMIYENLLPDATGTPKQLTNAVKTELNAAGVGFAFEQYGDSRT